jgi:hypothetical protein
MWRGMVVDFIGMSGKSFLKKKTRRKKKRSGKKKRGGGKKIPRSKTNENSSMV